MPDPESAAEQQANFHEFQPDVGSTNEVKLPSLNEAISALAWLAIKTGTGARDFVKRIVPFFDQP